MERSEKQAELGVLVEKFTKSQVAVCADYRGLTVAKISELRRELRKAGSEGRVVRNTLARLAVTKIATERGNSQSEVERFLATIVGPTLVVTCDNDPIAPTKVLAKFAKANEKFRVKGCWLDGAYVDPAGVVKRRSPCCWPSSMSLQRDWFDFCQSQARRWYVRSRPTARNSEEKIQPRRNQSGLGRIMRNV